MLKVILHGAAGHMGHVVAGIIAEEKDMEIVAGLDAREDDSLSFPVYTDPADCKEEADVLIDFSSAKALEGLLAFGLARKLPMVICTTGFTPEQLEKIEDAAKAVPVLRSANMSLGVNAIAKLVAEAARILYPAGFDIEVMEMHHRRKIDAPSGTALLLADSVNEALGGDMDYVYGRADRHEARPTKEIGISSLRGGTVVGEHEVVFAGQDEVIRITHSAFSRAIFAKGAVAAARFLCGKEPGLYTMPDVIG